MTNHICFGPLGKLDLFIGAPPYFVHACTLKIFVSIIFLTWEAKFPIEKKIYQ